MRKRLRALQPMICGKCGNDGVTPNNAKHHGVKRCTRAKNRPDYCVVCGEEFFTVGPSTMKVTNFGKMKKASAEDPTYTGQLIREARDVMRHTKWPAKKIYKHLVEHRRHGDTPETFA